MKRDHHTIFSCAFFHNLPVLLFLPLCFSVPDVYGQDNPQPSALYDQIQSLAKRHHFVVKGIENITDSPSRHVEGTAEQQLQQLLADFNYVVMQASSGAIEKLIIINKKTTSGTERIIVPMTTKNGHHFVNASIKGEGTDWLSIDLLIDTGADMVVLPESMITELEIADENMELKTLQTVNGKVDAVIGHLQALEIGNEIIEQVAVAFVPDEQMGDSNLLGMSVLGRYLISIDDAAQSITLTRK